MLQPKKRVAIIDGTPLMRRGLQSFLSAQPDLSPMIEASRPSEVLELVSSNPPDIIVTEALFPGSEGVFEFIPELHSLVGKIPVLVFSNINERVIASRVLQAGAQGYLMKSASENELGIAIRKLLSGGIYLSREMTERAVTTFAAPTPRTHRGDEVRELTNRELEVLDLVGAGMTSKDIAQVLHISLKTVESHRSHILAKLSLENSAELICYATQWRNLASHRGWRQASVASA
ncbi:LuxR C-terminal-related transcriptional regulator [Haloferula sp.]|uniref:LuxR C-terminal-related transcriptional regulator n=1 Tax=Haloferula sp. TaxID=2497595 RepID=UPI003C747208